MKEYKYEELTLTATSYDRKVSVEISKESDLYEVFEAFKTLILGLGYHPDSLKDVVAQYLEEDNDALIRERDAAVAKYEMLEDAIDDVSNICVTTGHPEFGIEVTMVIGDNDITLTNQPSVINALVNARTALNAKRNT